MSFLSLISDVTVDNVWYKTYLDKYAGYPCQHVFNKSSHSQEAITTLQLFHHTFHKFVKHLQWLCEDNFLIKSIMIFQAWPQSVFTPLFPRYLNEILNEQLQVSFVNWWLRCLRWNCPHFFYWAKLISQYWLRQQVVTWSYVDPDLYRHMISLGHIEAAWRIYASVN